MSYSKSVNYSIGVHLWYKTILTHLSDFAFSCGPPRYPLCDEPNSSTCILFLFFLSDYSVDEKSWFLLLPLSKDVGRGLMRIRSRIFRIGLLSAPRQVELMWNSHTIVSFTSSLSSVLRHAWTFHCFPVSGRPPRLRILRWHLFQIALNNRNATWKRERFSDTNDAWTW